MDIRIMHTIRKGKSLPCMRVSGGQNSGCPAKCSGEPLPDRIWFWALTKATGWSAWYVLLEMEHPSAMFRTCWYIHRIKERKSERQIVRGAIPGYVYQTVLMTDIPREVAAFY